MDFLNPSGILSLPKDEVIFILDFPTFTDVSVAVFFVTLFASVSGSLYVASSAVVNFFVFKVYFCTTPALDVTATIVLFMPVSIFVLMPSFSIIQFEVLSFVFASISIDVTSDFTVRSYSYVVALKLIGTSVFVPEALTPYTFISDKSVVSSA